MRAADRDRKIAEAKLHRPIVRDDQGRRQGRAHRGHREMRRVLPAPPPPTPELP